MNDKVIELGARKIVTVYSGEAGVSHNAGALTILESWRHIIHKTDHFFETFLSSQQRAMRLRPSEDVLICETRDLVKIGIVAIVFFRVADPMKAISEVGISGIDELVEETSIATLTNMMRGTCSNDIAQNSPSPTVASEKSHLAEQQQAAAVGAPSAPRFFDRAHDAFLAKLHDDFLEKYGLSISTREVQVARRCLSRFDFTAGLDHGADRVAAGQSRREDADRHDRAGTAEASGPHRGGSGSGDISDASGGQSGAS